MSKKTVLRTALIVPLALFSIFAQKSLATPFTSGDLFFASNVIGSLGATPVFDLTGGGDFVGASLFANAGAVGNRSLGQLAWTNDLETMYVTNYNGNTVYAVDSVGNAILFASMNQPAGIVVTPDDRILVNDFGGKQIVDITNPASQTLFATLPSFSRNMRQLPTGEILVAGSGGVVYDVASGTAVAYATIAGSTGGYLGDIDYTSDGRLFVTGGFSHRRDVFEITGGGAFADIPFATLTGVTVAASGAAFGLAIDQSTNQILVAPLTNDYVLDITAGGTVDAQVLSNRWAFNIPTTSDMAIDFVPFPVPEPSAIVLCCLLGFAGLCRGRR